MLRRILFLLALTAALLVAGCQTPAAPAASQPTAAAEQAAAPQIELDLDPIAQEFVTYLEGATPGGTFRMSYHGGPENFIPIYSVGGMQKYINQLHFGGLVRVAPDGRTWYPEVAESFEISDDGKEYTFYLRQDVVAHDGQPINADDIVFSLEAYATPKTGAGGGRSNTNYILGYEAFKEGTSEHLEGVQKIDDYTVKIILAQAVPDWLFGFRDFMVIPKGVLGQVPFEQWPDSRYNKELPVPGIGPFQLTEYEHGVRVVFERNDNFFRGKPLLDRILIEIIPSFDSIYLALQQGGIQWYDWITKPTLFDFQNDLNLVCEPDPFRTLLLGQNLGISFNQDQEYLQDIRVRQATAFAIDPDEVAAAQDGPTFRVEHMMSWNWDWTHSPNVKWSDRYTYDPDKARSLLEEAGWDFNRELVYLTDLDPNTTQLLLIQQLEAVGFKIRISKVDRPTAVQMTQTASPNYNWDINFSGIYGVGPTEALTRMNCEHPFTLTRWCDPEWDAWKMTVPFAEEDRVEFYQQADEYLFENLVYVLVPVYPELPTYGYACYNSKVHMVTNQMGINWPETWWIEP